MKGMLKDIAKGAVFKTCSFSPLLGAIRRKRLSGRAMVLMYHEVSDLDDVESWSVVKKNDLIRQLGFLVENFTIVDAKTAIERVENREGFEDKRPLLVITFDDGYAGNYGVLLPVIKRMNIPVTVFVATGAVQDKTMYWYDRLSCALNKRGPIELDLTRFNLGVYKINYCRGARNWREIGWLTQRLKEIAPGPRGKILEQILKDVGAKDGEHRLDLRSLTVEELKSLASESLVTIGAHSHCHNILTQLAYEDIRASIARSKTLLEGWTGMDIDLFSYPNGNYNEDIIEIVRGLGFRCAFTTEDRSWSSSENLFAVPRIGIGRYDTFDYFKIRVSGLMGGQ